MSTPTYTYGNGDNPRIDYPRMLIADTGPTTWVFSDQEIESAYQIQQSQFQSGMFYSGSAGRNLPASPVSYIRVAALLLDCLASSASKLANALKVLDIQVDQKTKSAELRAQAKAYRDMDDNAGAFFIAEMVNDQFSFRERFWSTVQRQSGQ